MCIQRLPKLHWVRRRPWLLAAFISRHRPFGPAAESIQLSQSPENMATAMPHATVRVSWRLAPGLALLAPAG